MRDLYVRTHLINENPVMDVLASPWFRITDNQQEAEWGLLRVC